MRFAEHRWIVPVIGAGLLAAAIVTDVYAPLLWRSRPLYLSAWIATWAASSLTALYLCRRRSQETRNRNAWTLVIPLGFIGACSLGGLCAP